MVQVPVIRGLRLNDSGADIKLRRSRSHIGGEHRCWPPLGYKPSPVTPHGPAYPWPDGRAGMNPMSGLCADAVRELDRSMGPRACGAVVSGRAAPGFRGLAGHESPHELTRRTLVAPVMRMMGYGEPSHDLDGMPFYNGTILATVPMNRPLDDALRQTVSFMRCHGTSRGVATDGFLWVLSERGPAGPRVVRVADLRPYYVEALDLARFRAAVPEDPAPAIEFLRAFGHGASRAPPLRASLRRHASSARRSTESAMPAMNSPY